MKVLLYSLGGQGCQEGGQLNEAISQYEKGNEVLVVHCDKTIGGCRENWDFCSAICSSCIFFQRKNAKKYFGKRKISFVGIGGFLTEEIKQKVAAFHSTYETLKDIKEITYRGVEIGYGLVSSYVSTTRNIEPQITPDLRKKFDRILKTEVLVSELLFEAVKQFQPDLIVFHNGRHWTYRPALGVAQNCNIPFICTDFVHLSDGSEAKCNINNSIPHDKDARAKIYLEFWENGKSEEHKIKEGKSFFERKRSNIYAGDFVYTAKQKSNTLPDNYDPSKKHIVIFNSSEDEMFSINKKVDNDKLFNTQLEGLKAIAQHFEGKDDVQVYLRVHPHLSDITFSYHTDIYKIESPNFTIIPASSTVSSYSLMDIADKVVVFGSTMGLEASFWGKDVINLAFSLYDNLGIVKLPKTQEELWSYLDSKPEPLPDNGNAIKVGYYMVSEDHPRLEYVNLKTYRFMLFGRRQEAESTSTLFGSPYIYWFYSKILHLVVGRVWRLFY